MSSFREPDFLPVLPEPMGSVVVYVRTNSTQVTSDLCFQGVLSTVVASRFNLLAFSSSLQSLVQTIRTEQQWIFQAF